MQAETETDPWEADDLAPRLAEAKPQAIKAAIQAGRLETYLRGVVGQPPQHRRQVMLDSQDSADLADLLADSEEKATEILDSLTPEELDALETSLRTIDPSGILAEEMRGMAPA
jgi:hypothetical protein